MLMVILAAFFHPLSVLISMELPYSEALFLVLVFAPIENCFAALSKFERYFGFVVDCELGGELLVGNLFAVYVGENFHWVA